jgi:hypothetical protein
VNAALNLVQALIWFWFEGVLITRLLRGNWRRFPLLFALVVAEFLIAVAELPTVWAVTLHGNAAARSWSARIYAQGEVFLEFLTLVLVISLIFRASAHLRSRNVMRATCVAGAILFVGISFRIHYDPRVSVGLWLTPWTRDLSLGASVLDVALWVLLLGRREKDGRILLLSGALGLEFAGAAMGHSLRSMATRYHAWPAMVGGKLVVITSIMRVYLWARAFRQPARAAAKGLPDAPR